MRLMIGNLFELTIYKIKEFSWLKKKQPYFMKEND
jgi:hypothetical protein